jgi:hypothetical protein
MNLEASIVNIGRDLVVCSRHCEGIILDPAKGILPRFLVLESQGRENSGAVVIGINPGRSSATERKFYIDRKLTYESTVEYWEHKGIKTRRYYTWLRSFVDQLGFDGPILWTELAKCEQTPEALGLLPLQTFRTCMTSFLRRELAAIPDTWPLVCAGSEPYKAIAYCFPERTVIGVPHPTGAFGRFHMLFDQDRLLPGVKAKVTSEQAGELKKAIWLSASP